MRADEMRRALVPLGGEQRDIQERQGVPARWGDPARGIPTATPG